MAKKVIGIILVILGVFNILGGIFAGIIFGLFGGVFGLVDDMSSLVVDEYATVETVEGYILDVDEDDTETTVYYEVDGYYYEGELNVYNSLYTEGTKVTVEYDSSDPANFAVPELSNFIGAMGNLFGGVGITIGIFGAIFGIGMLVIGIILIKKSKQAVETPVTL
ncbi:MAG: DUF3592 domain-containing protein [Lachnospiraceae bacterium]|nr:DUF3592 domain-containing protein [Lachnospiraceae bacterium]